MHEMLFRGKRKDNGEWIEGKGIYIDYDTALIFVDDCDYSVNAYSIDDFEVIPETVGRYTGLTDKNGRKIFEGDIVKRGFEIYIVRWNEEQFKYDFYTLNGAIQSGFNIFAKDYTEVIGNIYDNPELLEA